MVGYALALGAALALAFAIPAAAEEYHGGTSQKSKHAWVKTDAKGKPARFFVKWRADCDFTNNVQGRSFYIGFGRANKQRFRGRQSTKQRFDDYYVRIRSQVKGERRNPHAYGGVFKVKIIFKTYEGRKFGVCKSGAVRWFAHD